MFSKIVEGKHLESPKLTYHDGYYYMTSAQGGTGGPSSPPAKVKPSSRTSNTKLSNGCPVRDVLFVAQGDGKEPWENDDKTLKKLLRQEKPI